MLQLTSENTIDVAKQVANFASQTSIEKLL